MNEDQEKILNVENIVWIIYSLFAVGGIIANNLEIEDIKNRNQKNRKKYKTINIIIFLIASVINFFFLNIIYNRYKKTKNKNNFLTLLASFMIFISSLILLYVEITGEEIIPNE